MIEYHADDYGLFPAQSQRILDCHRMGGLNGISVIPNGPFFAQCMDMLAPYQEEIQIAVHLNFMEGKSICAREDADLLVDEEGNFNVSFGKLLLRSVLSGRERYRSQLRKEISAQIHAVLPYISGKPLRIDSHAHYHMIPVVFDALMDVILEQALPVSYIRIPREDIKIYRRCKRKLVGFRPVNLLKTLILNCLSKRNLSKYRDFTARLEQSVFMGVMYSGRMCIQNIQALRPEAELLAERLHQNIEILAHPGGVFEEEDIKCLTNRGDIAFLTSDFRREEAEAFMALREKLYARSGGR